MESYGKKSLNVYLGSGYKTSKASLRLERLRNKVEFLEEEERRGVPGTEWLPLTAPLIFFLFPSRISVMVTYYSRSTWLISDHFLFCFHPDDALSEHPFVFPASASWHPVPSSMKMPKHLVRSSSSTLPSTTSDPILLFSLSLLWALAFCILI